MLVVVVPGRYLRSIIPESRESSQGKPPNMYYREYYLWLRRCATAAIVRNCSSGGGLFQELIILVDNKGVVYARNVEYLLGMVEKERRRMRERIFSVALL